MDNAYIAEAADAMAFIATAVGKAADAAKYAAVAAKIRATVLARLFDASTGLFVDGDESNHSALAAQYFPAAFGFVGNGTRSGAGGAGGAPAAAGVENVKPILDLIENKTIARASEPACSCMGGHWLLQALYNIGSSTTDAAQGARAAAIAQAFIESPWTWRLMLAAGATTTMEVWTTHDKPNLSWSHPWCSAPANAIPRLLMGVAPIAMDYARVQVFPQPGNLTTAVLSLPTKHGVIGVAVNQTARAITATIAIPEGIAAYVCLPPTGVGISAESKAGHVANGAQIQVVPSSPSTATSMLSVDGVQVASPRVQGRMLCVPDDLSGNHVVARVEGGGLKV